MNDTNFEVRDRLLQRPVVPLVVSTTSAAAPVYSKACLLVGWSFRETTAGGTASLEIRAGDSGSGTVAGEVALASGGTDTHTICNEGLLCESGLSVNRLSGTFTGVLWVRV